MASFMKKLEKILEQNRNTPDGAVDLNEDQRDSPTRVHPDHGEAVTANFGGKGGQTVDATGPIKTGVAAATLKTQPGDTSGGPTGHVPVNSDLPRPQLGGLDKDNKAPGKAKYTLGEESDDKEKPVDEEKKFPAFLKKKDDKDKDDKSKDVKEDKDEDDTKNANDRAGYTAKSKSGGMSEEAKGKAEKFDEEAEKEDKKAVAEATALLMKGEELSEAFKEKTSTIFEATLSLRLTDYRKKLNERYEGLLDARVEEIREQLSDKVNSHLDLVVESWMSTNEVDVQKGIKAELVEDFIGGLKSLFEEHYIDLPADKVDVVAEMAKKIGSLETKLNEQINDNAALLKKAKLFEKTEIFNKVAVGLTSTQAEKLRSLAESIEFKSAAQYEKSVSILKESIDTMPKKAVGSAKQTDLSEQVLNQNLNKPSQPAGMVSSVKESLARMEQNA